MMTKHNVEKNTCKYDEPLILSDISGSEDASGDMDLKLVKVGDRIDVKLIEEYAGGGRGAAAPCERCLRLRSTALFSSEKIISEKSIA